ncbi:spore germination protein D [Paenibacillus sp. RU4T]|uniref:spore germination lipoprotein GerD n=1 Tax=unclassified Paenibacillus TaxID=185978 RepID=UPI0009551D35|nr:MULTISPECIES: spore germination lipoprotein GerD [unclassified Paenibacillus]SIR71144.1 spore germination protein D [Paenibacillus sp. RU4X]SIR78445.1 spore germination protein D [Paenibacillus sp. RU4T]
MKLKRALYCFSISAFAAVLLTGCGAEPQGGGGQQTSYKDMKSMVIDILKTEDAQKALQESQMSAAGTSSSGIKSLSVQDAESVRMAVKETITSPDYDKVIKQLMTDTRFAGDFAKAVNKENKDIHKELMKDPGYQKELISAMKTPEMDKMILEVLMTIMQESMSNPLFRVEILDLLKKAVQEELRVKPGEKVDTSSGGGGEGGDSGGEDGGGGGDDSKDSGEGSGTSS